MATSNGGYLHSNPPPPAPTLLPPWLSNSGSTASLRPPSSPSVTLSLCPSAVSSSPIPWLQPETGGLNNPSLTLGSLQSHGPPPLSSPENTSLVSELSECCRELEKGHRAWTTYKKEAAWGLKRLELQLESEKARRRREKMEEVEAKINALKEEQKAALERIEAEYREQLTGLRRDAEAKEQKLAEQWATKHLRLTKFLEQMGCRPRLVDPNSR
ncbi:transcription factor AS1-like [Punica granatum]|uniref:Uncharacterized protein n=2 Tax=Punica granatum TaxID=22663 RepID=A0A218WZY5_PUNGR|nr:transcription factor AS1-like [Punica granatum]XP_031401974.1 transcription factor AS1-like [Punica granatum]XP_031401975.1 transcription factor AS1-like [Punica granatum]XP_031401976.1 transcription factor AS1-like [Punica granatum]OWM77940.1 hypothetical protein CDL15_Pgr018509 [Punica granatum]PKI73006.1 hypothetical protein CRG98_006609 [Punica granatum]